MHGPRPEDIKYISHLRNATLTMVCVGQYQLDFVFSPTGNISVEGRCELLDNSVRQIDVWERGTRSAAFLFFDLLGESVIDVAIDSPKSLKLVFSKGQSLRVIDNSEQYESFSVGGLYV